MPAPALSRYDLYRCCVQDAPRMVRFLLALHGGDARVLREDFCGPATLSHQWALLSPDHAAVAVDRDEEPLTHAREAGRAVGVTDGQVAYRCVDVRSARDRADVVALFNFAICELHDRATLVGYLRHLRRCLRPGGVVVLDIYGGARAFVPGRIRTTARTDDGRTIHYQWQQVQGNPATGMVRNALHFRVGARSWARAFEYHWRLWSIPELRDALAEAGLGCVEVHDRMGHAVDQRGRLHLRPLNLDAGRAGEGDVLDEDYVAYLAARPG